MKKLTKLSMFIVTLASTSILALPATVSAGDGVSIQQQMQQIQQQLQLLTQRVERQEEIISSQQSQIRSQAASLGQQALLVSDTVAAQLNLITPAGGNSDSGFEIEFKPSPKISSMDGNFVFQPFGRLHLDTAFFNDDVQDNPDNMHLRRARLGFKGKVAHDWKYKIELDFGGESSNLKESYLAYTGFKDITLRAGNFKPALGLENTSSSNYIQFIERAAPEIFTRSEILGVGASTGGENWSLSASVSNDDAGVNSGADDESWQSDLRASYAPINQASRVIHLGAAVSLRKPDASTDSFRLRARPEVSIGSRFVDTGTISNVDSIRLYGLELAGVYDSLSLQGEYINADVNLDGAGSDPEFSGWYTQATYFLTGESRPYSAKTGKFGRVKPISPFSLKDSGSIGAWELALRYSNTDLNDSGAGILGGEMDNWTIGINWYINNHVRLMANYIMVDTDANATIANANPDILLVRAAVDF